MEQGALALPVQQAVQGPREVNNIQGPPRLKHQRERASSSADGSRKMSRNIRPPQTVRGALRRASTPSEQHRHDSSSSGRGLDLAVQGQRAQLHQRVARRPVRQHCYQQQHHEQQQCYSPSAAALFHQAEQDQLLAAYVAHMQAVGSPQNASATNPYLQQHMQYVWHASNNGGCTHYQLDSNAIDWNGILSRQGSGASPCRLTDLMGLLPQPKFEQPRPEGPAIDTPSSMATGSARSNISPGAPTSACASPAAAAMAAAAAAAAAAGAPYDSPGLAAALAVSSYACQQHFSSYWNNAILSPAASESQTAEAPAAAGDQPLTVASAAAAAVLPGAPPPIRTQNGPHRSLLQSDSAQMAAVAAITTIHSSSGSGGGSSAKQWQQQWHGNVAPFWLGMHLAAAGGSSAAHQAGWFDHHQQQQWQQQGLVAGQISPSQAHQQMQHVGNMLQQQQQQQWTCSSSPRHGSSGGGQQGAWSPGHTRHSYQQQQQQQHYPSRLAAMTHGILHLKQPLAAVQEHDGTPPGTAGRGAEASYRRSQSYAGSCAAAQRHSSGGGGGAAAAAHRHSSGGGDPAAGAAGEAPATTPAAHKGSRGSSNGGGAAGAGRLTSRGGAADAAAQSAHRCSQPGSATAATAGSHGGSTSSSGWVHANRQYSSSSGSSTPAGYGNRHCNSSTLRSNASTAADGAVQCMQQRSSSGGGTRAWQPAHESTPTAPPCTAHMQQQQQQQQQLWSGQQQQQQQQLVRPAAGPKVQHIVQQLQQRQVQNIAPGRPRLHSTAHSRAVQMPLWAKHGSIISEGAARAGAAAPAAGAFAAKTASNTRGRSSSGGGGGGARALGKAPFVVGTSSKMNTVKDDRFFLDVEQAISQPAGSTCQPSVSTPERCAAISPSKRGLGVSERLKWWEQQQQQVLAVTGVRARGPGYIHNNSRGGGSSGRKSSVSNGLGSHTAVNAVALRATDAAPSAAPAADGLGCTAGSGSNSSGCKNSSSGCQKVSQAILQAGQEGVFSTGRKYTSTRQPGRQVVGPAAAGSPAVRGQRWSAKEYLASAALSRIPPAPLGPSASAAAQQPSAPGTPTVSKVTGAFFGSMLPPIRTSCLQRPKVGKSTTPAAAAAAAVSSKQQLPGSFNASGPVVPATPQPCDATGPAGPTAAQAGQSASCSPIKPSPKHTRYSASGSSTASSSRWSSAGGRTPRANNSLSGRQACRGAFASHSGSYNSSNNVGRLGGRQQQGRLDKLGGGSVTRSRGYRLDRRHVMYSLGECRGNGT